MGKALIKGHFASNGTGDLRAEERREASKVEDKLDLRQKAGKIEVARLVCPIWRSIH
jgi:hypothetical protein